jgi:hypothetical protein
MNKLLNLQKIHIKKITNRKPYDVLLKNKNLDGFYYQHQIKIFRNTIFQEPLADIIRIEDFSGFIDSYIDNEKVDYRYLIKNYYSSGRKLSFRILPDCNLLITPISLTYTGYILKKVIKFE